MTVQELIKALLKVGGNKEVVIVTDEQEETFTVSALCSVDLSDDTGQVLLFSFVASDAEEVQNAN